MGGYCSLPSETSKYTRVFLASPGVPAGDATGDSEIEKCFEMSVVLVLADDALSGIGTAITSVGDRRRAHDRPVSALAPSAAAGKRRRHEGHSSSSSGRTTAIRW